MVGRSARPAEQRGCVCLSPKVGRISARLRGLNRRSPEAIGGARAPVGRWVTNGRWVAEGAQVRAKRGRGLSKKVGGSQPLGGVYRQPFCLSPKRGRVRHRTCAPTYLDGFIRYHLIIVQLVSTIYYIAPIIPRATHIVDFICSEMVEYCR